MLLDIIYSPQAPFEVPCSMPMVNVIELFRRVGMRFCLVTDKGSLVGMLTKKDILRHIADQNQKTTHHLDVQTLTMS